MSQISSSGAGSEVLFSFFAISVLAATPTTSWSFGTLNGVKTLLLMRHGKSDWEADYDADHERPLNKRGVRSAKVMGEVLAERGLDPQAVISSTAVRARTTAELAAEAGGWRGPLTLDRRLYEAAPSTVIEVASAAGNVDRLMLVGHQPTWGATVHRLTDEFVEVKTATVVVIEADLESWVELSPGMGRLIEVLNPRDFLGR